MSKYTEFIENSQPAVQSEQQKRNAWITKIGTLQAELNDESCPNVKELKKEVVTTPALAWEILDDCPYCQGNATLGFMLSDDQLNDFSLMEMYGAGFSPEDVIEQKQQAIECPCWVMETYQKKLQRYFPDTPLAGKRFPEKPALLDEWKSGANCIVQMEQTEFLSELAYLLWRRVLHNHDFDVLDDRQKWRICTDSDLREWQFDADVRLGWKTYEPRILIIRMGFARSSGNLANLLNDILSQRLQDQDKVTWLVTDEPLTTAHYACDRRTGDILNGSFKKANHLQAAAAKPAPSEPIVTPPSEDSPKWLKMHCSYRVNTAKAVKLECEVGGRLDAQWFPLSKIKEAPDWSQTREHDEVEVSIDTDILKDRGWL